MCRRPQPLPCAQALEDCKAMLSAMVAASSVIASMAWPHSEHRWRSWSKRNSCQRTHLRSLWLINVEPRLLRSSLGHRTCPVQYTLLQCISAIFVPGFHKDCGHTKFSASSTSNSPTGSVADRGTDSSAGSLGRISLAPHEPQRAKINSSTSSFCKQIRAFLPFQTDQCSAISPFLRNCRVPCCHEVLACSSRFPEIVWKRKWTREDLAESQRV